MVEERGGLSETERKEGWNAGRSLGLVCFAVGLERAARAWVTKAIPAIGGGAMGVGLWNE